MASKRTKPQKLFQWRLECLGHSVIEGLAGLLPGAAVFRLGEALGGLVWHLMPARRRTILRNLRIAYAGEKELPELRRMARETFRRSGGNLISAAYTARLTPEKLARVIHIENLELLEQALAKGRGVVLLLSHMGNWELLSRLVHLFPAGSKAGAFYRPLNNPLLDKRVLDRRQADGTRMFSKRDPFHQVTGFLREGGIVGILADQRVGLQGEVVSFFGRLTRASPLPSLLARRAKSEVLALALVTERPGKWKAVFMPVAKPPSTPHCMISLERAMKASPMDVFWLQERWRVSTRADRPIATWLGADSGSGEKRHRALLWLAGVPDSWRLPAEWTHPDLVYEVVLAAGQEVPAWLSGTETIHRIPPAADGGALRKALVSMEFAAALPIDFIFSWEDSEALQNAALREGIRVMLGP